MCKHGKLTLALMLLVGLLTCRSAFAVEEILEGTENQARKVLFDNIDYIVRSNYIIEHDGYDDYPVKGGKTPTITNLKSDLVHTSALKRV